MVWGSGDKVKKRGGGGLIMTRSYCKGNSSASRKFWSEEETSIGRVISREYHVLGITFMSGFPFLHETIDSRD